MKSIFKKHEERKLIMAKGYLTIAEGLLNVANDLDDKDPKRLEYTYEALCNIGKACLLIGSLKASKNITE